VTERMKSIGLLLLVSGLAAFASAQDGYGAGQANSRTASQMGGGARNDYNYFALRDHPGPSGVPLGGIGVGCVDLAPDGHFSRIGLNNWFTDGLSRVRGENPELERGSFLALWEGRGEDGITRRLDYLVGLGIDAIWISPIFPSGTSRSPWPSSSLKP